MPLTLLIISVIVVLILIILGLLFYRRIQKKYTELSNKFNTLFNESIDQIYIIDFNGNFIEFNNTICKVLGFSKDELHKMQIKDIKSGKHVDTVPFLIEKLKKSGYMIFESEHLTKDKRIIPVEIISRIIDYNSDKAILYCARDKMSHFDVRIPNAVRNLSKK